ncbi:MAG: PhoH family protein [Spirochaetaceae bacterium]|nr:PhoH family protein [Spirochaetaceae bacterium]
MDDSIAIVLETRDLVSGVCGANDDNLKALSLSLGGKVAVKGNEVRMKGLDKTGIERFKTVMDDLITAVREGDRPSPDYVHALARTSLDKKNAGYFRDALITIPNGFGKIFPKSSNQGEYIKAIKNYELCFAIGPAGTGKTFLAIAHALSTVLSKKMRKLVLTRPVVESGESLGYLPGDLEQKINPYLRPLYDAMESLVPYEIIRRLEENRIIEIAPLAYMRGRSFNDSFIILDEAQNTTKEQMKMFLTRLGSSARAVITGDITQIDLPKRIESGLLNAVSVLSDVDGVNISYLHTQDVVRNPLVKRIIEAYNNEKEK